LPIFEFGSTINDRPWSVVVRLREHELFRKNRGILALRLADCKYEWLRRQDPKPRICPNCDRRGWDRVESIKPARVAIPVPVWRPKLATRISAEEFKRRTKQLPKQVLLRLDSQTQMLPKA